ncbi:hypothetical protein FKM82_020200 [Ascaphus truei]
MYPSPSVLCQRPAHRRKRRDRSLHRHTQGEGKQQLHGSSPLSCTAGTEEKLHGPSFPPSHTAGTEGKQQQHGEEAIPLPPPPPPPHSLPPVPAPQLCRESEASGPSHCKGDEAPRAKTPSLFCTDLPPHCTDLPPSAATHPPIDAQTTPHRLPPPHCCYGVTPSRCHCSLPHAHPSYGPFAHQDYAPVQTVPYAHYSAAPHGPAPFTPTPYAHYTAAPPMPYAPTPYVHCTAVPPAHYLPAPYAHYTAAPYAPAPYVPAPCAPLGGPTPYAPAPALDPTAAPLATTGLPVTPIVPDAPPSDTPVPGLQGSVNKSRAAAKRSRTGRPGCGIRRV